jgi:hypothetical protein
MHETKKGSDNQTTWWWKEYGQDGNFSLVDFVDTIFIREV